MSGGGLNGEAEEFSDPRNNFIVGRDGFSVEVVGRLEIRYQDARRSIAMFAEPLVSTSPTMAVRRLDIKGLTDDDREQVLANIQRAFGFKGWILQIE